MARGINKVILIGNLGQDPEFRSTGSGQPIASFSLATSESWKDKTSGERIERTEWHRIAVWGRLAEVCRDYLHKGSKVYVEGRLQTRKWQDKDGNDRYTTEIVANEMQMLDGRGDAGDSRDARSDSRRDYGGSAAPAKPGAGMSREYDEAPILDDDIPF